MSTSVKPIIHAHHQALFRKQGVHISLRGDGERCLCAARRLDAGVSLTPGCVSPGLLVVPTASSRRTTCAHCGKTTSMVESMRSVARGDVSSGECVRFLRCSGCKLLRYCSRSCQANSWKMVHKDECAMIRRMPREPTETMLLLARYAQMKAKHSAHMEAKHSAHMEANDSTRGSTPSMAHGVSSLCTHKHRFSTTEVEDMTMVVSLVLKYLSPHHRCAVDASELLSIACAFKLNNFTIRDDCTGEQFGVGVFAPLNLLNHSCWPNCVVTFEGFNATVRTLRAIAPGEELCVSYVEIGRTREERRSDLSHSFKFQCACDRCVEESPADREEYAQMDARNTDGECESSSATSLRPLQPIVSHVLEDYDDDDDDDESDDEDEDGKAIATILSTRGESQWPYESEPPMDVLPYALRGEEKQMMRLLDEEKQMMRLLDEEDKEVEKTPSLPRGTAPGPSHSRLRLGLLSVRHRVVRCLNRLVDWNVRLHHWEAAARWCGRSLAYYDAAYPENFPLIALQYYRHGKLLSALGNPQAMRALHRAHHMLNVSHGPKHPLCMQLRYTMGM